LLQVVASAIKISFHWKVFYFLNLNSNVLFNQKQNLAKLLSEKSFYCASFIHCKSDPNNFGRFFDFWLNFLIGVSIRINTEGTIRINTSKAKSFVSIYWAESFAIIVGKSQDKISLGRFYQLLSSWESLIWYVQHLIRSFCSDMWICCFVVF
jgi:hypothetical protein